MLNELTTPLRDVVNYEGQIGNDTDIYQKLAWAQEQLNASVEEIQNTVGNIMICMVYS